MTLHEIQTRRMHGLYLSRGCDDIVELSREMLGLHCWFHRNVCFSALIRGAPLFGWKNALIKTWLYRGTLHGTAFDDLPSLLALHNGNAYLANHLGEARIEQLADEVVRYMEDGVYSRAEFRRIFSEMYDAELVDALFSPWGGIFVYLAGQGRVAFRDMTSRDFDFISAEPTQTADEVLPELLHRYFEAYGPATLKDAAYFFGYMKEGAKRFADVPTDGLDSFQIGRETYYYTDKTDIADMPSLTLLSGFDPIIVSYTERSAVLPEEYKSRVILKSGICNPTVAIDGRVAGIWNIKKNEPQIEFFTAVSKKVSRAAYELVDKIRMQMLFNSNFN